MWYNFMRLTWEKGDLLFEDGKHIDGLHILIAVKPWNTETWRGQQALFHTNKPKPTFLLVIIRFSSLSFIQTPWTYLPTVA